MKLIKLSTLLAWACVITSFAYSPTEAADEDPCGGSGWVAYKDTKCFYLIEKFATRNEAQSLCKQLGDSSSKEKTAKQSPPTLATIKTDEEQQFLDKYLFETSEVFTNVWIGAKRDPTTSSNESQFLWDDGSVVEYSNWFQDSPSAEGKRECVQLQGPLSRSLHSTAGQWKDVTCKLGNFAVCQKYQPWTLDKLQQYTLDLQLQLERTKANLVQTKASLVKTNANLVEVKLNPVPIGFIYVQFPKDLSPEKIWPWMTWTSVSGNYSGYFFRVEGGQAAQFGVEQKASQSGITRVRTDYGNYDYGAGYEPSLEPGTWSGKIATGYYNSPYYMTWQLYTSDDETRPINMAMKLWKRTA